ncbi:multiple sugar transport system substrate-binding protein [Caldalkalibacillus uzonensis]|uniref:Multiple sugar transport system substrate-binding protein n=1 Tax=Caldalkalibacillus uzonensis TaxID=353224 RepID=A0ABU0CQI5_9BACI|nr:extracellular solute-binding protein [Caldalkalibacillus uzonensis]MDQ0338666.1 multiple sugar transport system substrate-binding protein [Caldalkalibacillus uzonensis]
MKKLMSVLALLSALLLVVVACSNSEEPAQPDTGENESATNEEENELSGEITIMVPAGGYYYDHTRNFLAKKFMERHPNVKVNVEQEPDGGQLTARLAAGDIPDILVGVFGYQPAKFAQQGMIVNLAEMPGADELFDRVSEHYVQEHFGGKYYVPWNATTQMMIYNKALFEEAGLDPDNPPTTFEEYLAAAEAIHNLPDREDGSKVFGNVFWNEALAWGGWYWTMKAQIYYNFNDGKYGLFNELGTDVVFDEEEAGFADFLTFMRQAQEYAPEQMENNDFFSRNVGMWLQFGYGWKANLAEAKDGPMVIGEDVGVAPIPVRQKGDTHWSTLDGRSLMIFKSNPEQERLAFEFIKFMMEDDINLESLKALEQLPTLKSLQNHEYFQAEDIKPFVEQLEHAIINEPVAELDDVSNIILQYYIETVIHHNLTPEEAVERAAEEARQILHQN